MAKQKKAIKSAKKTIAKAHKPKPVVQEKKVVAPEKETKLHLAGHIPKIKQGKYSDGLPFDELNNLSFKIILKPNRFVSRKSLFDFGNIISKPAHANGISYKPKNPTTTPVKIREVLFVDTPDARLYNNSFILRRRIAYEDGFPVSDPEIVFKFRHQDIQKTAETDVRPQITGDHKIKFKCQVLPLAKDLKMRS